MTDYFMGEKLPQELAPGEPVPAVTPPGGVVVQKRGLDGWNRKWLVRSSMGPDGRSRRQQFLIAEIAPESREIPRNVMGIARPVLQNRLPAERIRTSSLRLGQISPTVPTAEPPPPPPPPPPPGPQANGPEPLACPGPVEMPDGSTLNPDDPISLKVLCEIIPYLAENIRNSMRGRSGRTGPVPLTGAQGPYATVISPPSGFFGAPGFDGGGGGSMGGFPGGGGGGPGPRGPAGPPGIGAAPNYLVKTDGDYSAGPGSFVAVPGTSLSFNQSTDGAAIFFLQAAFGCSGSEAQSDQIGFRVTDSNGVSTDYPATPTLLHTGVANVGVFFQPAVSIWPVSLSAGNYTVEVILRGMSAGEFCSASGLGFAATVSANAQVPLALIAFHT